MPNSRAQCGLGLVLRGVAERRRKAYADRPLCAVAIQGYHLRSNLTPDRALSVSLALLR